MGQYYLVVNPVKREFLHPHKFGDGLKLTEFGVSEYGTMAGLAVLLADGNGWGSGDLHTNNPIVGSWAGDPVIIAGDYADPLKHVPIDLVDRLKAACLAKQPDNPDYAHTNSTLHSCAKLFFTDISDHVLLALADDEHIKAILVEELEGRRTYWKEDYPLPLVLKTKLYGDE